MMKRIPKTNVIGLSYSYLVGEFLETIEKQSTHDVYRNRLNVFGKYLSEIDVEIYNNLNSIRNVKSLNKVILRLQKEYKQSTCKTILTNFKMLVAYGVDNEGLSESIPPIVSKLKVTKKKDAKKQNLPTKDEMLKLRTHMEKNSATLFDLKCRTAIECIYSSGCRVTELLNARWEDYDVEKKVIFVWAEQTKSDKDYFLILSDNACQLLDVLKQYQSGEYIFTNKENKPMNRSSLSTYIQRNCKEVGLPNINLHLIRKFVATEMLANGVDLGTVSNYVLHHSSIQTTARYILPNEKKAIDVISNVHKNW